MIEQAQAEAQKHSEKAAELAKQIEESKDRQRKMILDYRKKYGKELDAKAAKKLGMEPFKTTNARRSGMRAMFDMTEQKIRSAFAALVKQFSKMQESAKATAERMSEPEAVLEAISAIVASVK
jgi:hypothetical protein